jgi:hypothetical protein
MLLCLYEDFEILKKIKKKLICLLAISDRNLSHLICDYGAIRTLEFEKNKVCLLAISDRNLSHLIYDYGDKRTLKFEKIKYVYWQFQIEISHI